MQQPKLLATRAAADSIAGALRRDGFYLMRGLLGNEEVDEIHALLLRASLRAPLRASSSQSSFARPNAEATGTKSAGAPCSGVLIRPAGGGIEIPDLLAPGLRSLRRAVDLPLAKPALSALLRLAFNGTDYSFLNSSDAQINMSSTWHRDVLHGRYRRALTAQSDDEVAVGEDLPPRPLYEWPRRDGSINALRAAAEIRRHPHSGGGGGDDFRMYRLIVYLQDHQDLESEHALHVAAGSHASPGCRCDGGGKRATEDGAQHESRGASRKLSRRADKRVRQKSNGQLVPACPTHGPNRGFLEWPTQASAAHMGPLLALAPAKGDAVLIDQRLVHRGFFKHKKSGVPMQRTRVRLSLTFGSDRNALTRAWVAGDAQRKRDLSSRRRQEGSCF